MSGASDSKAKATDPPSPTSSSRAPMEQPRRYSRFTGSDIGDRLANARNMNHTQAPPPPPFRAVMGAPGGGVPLSSIPPGSVEPPERYFIPPPGGPKYGSERGSYRSPYDYNITIGATGSVPAPAQARTWPFPYRTNLEEEFLQPSTSGLPEGKAWLWPYLPRTGNVCVSAQQYQPPADAEERTLLLGPLRMLRSRCVKAGDTDNATWIDVFMGDRLHKIVEHDPFLPNVVYKVSIPMTYDHWCYYNDLLRQLEVAKTVHEQLAVGWEEFDQYTTSERDHREAFKVLAQGRLQGMTMEEVAANLVMTFRNGWTWSGVMLQGGEFAGAQKE